jgi:pilus assembly protein CpaD
MVDNPTDLVQPRADGPSATTRRTTVLDKYRQGQPTATTYPTTGQGQISGLGR